MVLLTFLYKKAQWAAEPLKFTQKKLEVSYCKCKYVTLIQHSYKLQLKPKKCKILQLQKQNNTGMH